MPLTPGTRLGPYEIVAAIGAGGMGEVYRAHDRKLGRDVAIKMLPDAVAHDPDRLMRFEREAKTLAALNHPNIAQIYGLEESDPSTSSGQAGTRALVMELVEGRDLSELIAGRIPSSTGGAFPLWARNGRELFFISGAPDSMMMSVPVETTPSFTQGTPVPLFPAGGYLANVARNFDISRDGTRFLMIKSVSSTAPGTRPSLVVVSHWFDEVRPKMGSK